MFSALIQIPLAQFCFSQTIDDNYVKTYKALTSITGDISTINDKTKVAEGVEYYDGLGRPLQAVVRQGTPLGYDFVTFWVYDGYGRKTKSYLPYATNEVSGAVKSLPIMGQALFHQNQVGASDGQYAFSVQLVESSDLARVMKQGAPGAAWQPVDTDPYNINDHTVKKRYEVNGVNEVLRFSYDGLTGLVSLPVAAALRYYDQEQLYANKTLDENNNEVIEYTDKEGRTVCKKVKASATEYACTYYLYDATGNLMAVVPPEAVKVFTN